MYGVGSKVDLRHPSWKTSVEKTPPLFRTPKHMRSGIAGGELGPTFVQ